MNGWIISGFVLALLGFVASIALRLRDKISQLEAENNALRLQLEEGSNGHD